MSVSRPPTNNRIGAKGFFLMVAILGFVSGCTDTAETAVPVLESEVSDALIERDGELGIEVLTPADGANVPSTFEVVVKTTGIRLAPKGRTLDGEAHFHVLVDKGCVRSGEVIGVNETSIHVGDGSDRVELTLPPGKHSLCIQLGDGFHAAVSLTDEIVVNVVDEETAGR